MEWFSADDYWLSRLVFQRALALVYLLAFLNAVSQFRALIGEHGLTPVPSYLRRTSWRQAPTLFRLYYSDRFFAAVAWVGVVISAALLVGLGDGLPLAAHMSVWALLWAFYLSIVHVGQIWYGFGWESLLCEVGFLAIFLGPSDVAPPLVVLVALRWVLFRVEFGAGMIKLRGDACWRDLTCLNYHHETQPMPNPLSWRFHNLPQRAHKVEVAANHVTQLAVPFMLFLPQPVAGAAAGVMIVTQLWLVLSGNFAWLNALTIVVALPVVGDDIWNAVLPVTPPAETPVSPVWHQAVVLVIAAAVVVLSYPTVRNLVTRRQVMNTSYTSLMLVNSYGAFGSVTRVRNEVVLEGTDDPNPDGETEWREYEFKGKPGDVRRRPPQIAPYHLRLDWLMWFAALSRAYSRSWFEPLLVKLLQNDRRTVRLIRHNPFPDRPPTAVRASFYRYRFTTKAERRRAGAWWERTYIGEFHRPVSLPAEHETSKDPGRHDNPGPENHG